MARRTKKEMQEKEDLQLLDECIDHQAQSAKMLETVSSTWDEKEAMLIGKLEDSLSKKAKSKIFDPRLSTIVFERASRAFSASRIVCPDAILSLSSLPSLFPPAYFKASLKVKFPCAHIK